jgi:hypothetical protein
MAQIISSRMKYTRAGGVFYVAILDQTVRTYPEILWIIVDGQRYIVYYLRNQIIKWTEIITMTLLSTMPNLKYTTQPY